MNRISWVALGLAFAACTDAGCPEGSREVDGLCMTFGTAEQNDGGADGSTLHAEDAGGADAGGTDAGAPNAGGGGAGGTDAGAMDAGAPDAGATETGALDAGAREDSGRSDEPKPPGCELLECGEHARCETVDGHAACVCEAGFEGDGILCADVDECEDGTASCHEQAACHNEPGGFRCECSPGYEGDGETCTPNPCEPRANPCDPATTTCRAEGEQAICDCLEGRGRCDGDPHACATDLRTDQEHCGECGAACAGDLACEAGACEQRVVQLELGAYHSCALQADGAVLCWGMSDGSLLAREDSSRFSYEPAPTRFRNVRALSVGATTSCAITAEHDLFCWGTSVFSWVAPGPEQGVFEVARGIRSLERIAMSTYDACMLERGNVKCWGMGYVHGTSDAEQRSFSEAAVISVPEVVQLASGDRICAIARDRSVHCWGGAAAPRVVTDASGEPIEGRDVDASPQVSTACAATSDGQARCWGDNRSGQLGNPAIASDETPFAVLVVDASGIPLTEIEEVAVGAAHACARKGDGTVWCWGRRDRVGNGASGSTPQPFAAQVNGIDDALEIAAGGHHTCVRRRSGQVQCWGDNTSGQLGVSLHPATGGGTFFGTPVNAIGLP